MKALQALASVALLTAAADTAFAQDLQPRMGSPLPGLTASELDRFTAGRDIFNLTFADPAGGGPIFNDTSCGGCHAQPDAGGGGSINVTRFGKIDQNGFDPLANLGGSLLQRSSINTPTCDEVIPPEANVTAERMTPPCFGFGLLEGIADADIVFYEQNPPAGISGKVHWVEPLETPGGQLRAGRFGWKAQVATVLSFSGDALNNEMGVTNKLLPSEQIPNGDPLLLAQCDSVADPEDAPDGQGFDAVDRMTDFQRFLAAPPQMPRSGMTGAAIFDNIGCADCHVSTPYVTVAATEAALSNKTIQPYSDFLLHDIGTGDGIVQGAAEGSEFRTMPLWGLTARAELALLHDGSITGATREQNVDAAILAHENEAAAAKNAYLALSNTDVDHLINFLLSLGQMEFDAESDHDIDEFDWFFAEAQFTGPTPVTPITADDDAAIHDFDADGDFDLRDVGVFQRAFTGNL